MTCAARGPLTRPQEPLARHARFVLASEPVVDQAGATCHCPRPAAAGAHQLRLVSSCRHHARLGRSGHGSLVDRRRRRLHHRLRRRLRRRRCVGGRGRGACDDAKVPGDDEREVLQRPQRPVTIGATRVACDLACCVLRRPRTTLDGPRLSGASDNASDIGAAPSLSCVVRLNGLVRSTACAWTCDSVARNAAATETVWTPRSAPIADASSTARSTLFTRSAAAEQRAVQCCNAPCSVATRRAVLQHAVQCCNAPCCAAGASSTLGCTRAVLKGPPRCSRVRTSHPSVAPQARAERRVDEEVEVVDESGGGERRGGRVGPHESGADEQCGSGRLDAHDMPIACRIQQKGTRQGGTQTSTIHATQPALRW